jgi:hypothetical protein
VTSMMIEWIRDWAVKRQIRVSVDGILSLAYEDPALHSRVTVLTDSERTPGDLVLLANRLVWVCPEDETDALSDNQYLFLVRESGIWGDMTEGLASDAFASLSKAHGLSPDARALLVQEGESRIAVLLVLNAILFRWDAYLIPFSGRFLCHLSHDGYIDLRAREEALLSGLLRRFEAWGAEERPT